MLYLLYSYFRLSENKTINVFPIEYLVQLSKLMSQWANKSHTEVQQVKFTIYRHFGPITTSSPSHFGP